MSSDAERTARMLERARSTARMQVLKEIKRHLERELNGIDSLIETGRVNEITGAARECAFEDVYEYIMFLIGEEKV